MEITRSRPTGISIIAVLVFIQAALEIIYGLLVLIAAPGFVTSSGTATSKVSCLFSFRIYCASTHSTNRIGQPMSYSELRTPINADWSIN